MFNAFSVLRVDYKGLTEGHGITVLCLLQIVAHVNWDIFFVLRAPMWIPPYFLCSVTLACKSFMCISRSYIVISL